MKTLLNCIEEIPERLTDIYDGRENLFELLKGYIGNKKINKIVVVASGTSFNGAFTTKLFGEKILNIPVDIIYPNLFLNYFNKNLLSEDILYLFISQTGTTRLVYNSLKLVKDKGLMNISITEDLNSPIAKEASLVIDMKTGGEKYIYRTIGYSATCGILYMLYLNILRIKGNISCDDYTAYGSDFLLAVNNLENIMDEVIKWYSGSPLPLRTFKKFIFSGTSDLYPVAMEADIKFMEMVPVFTNSFEIEELIHGPQNAFDDETGYFLISKAGADSDKAIKIADFIHNEIGNNSIIVGNNIARDTDINIEVKSKNFYPLEVITVFQVLAYKLAVDKGRDLSVRLHSEINNYITKSL